MERLLVLSLLVSMAWAESAISYKDKILELHNNYRSEQKGSNIQKMVWNETLSGIADNWIQRCDFEHEGAGFGENLYFESTPDSLDALNQVFVNATAAWYSEIHDYRKSTAIGCAATSACHYTQMVWYRTKQIGCAYKKCDGITFAGNSFKNMLYVACWYAPKGNWATIRPFAVGDGPCTDCYEGQHCENNLCAGEGEEPCIDKSDDCILYKANGDCENNPLWMGMECRQTCEICKGGPKKPCENKDVNCERYLQYLKEPRIKETCARPYMQNSCRQACKLC